MVRTSDAFDQHDDVDFVDDVYREIEKFTGRLGSIQD
jgi:hypothetical protein